MKWRDVVSFAGHALCLWARNIGRCLQLLIQELGGRGEGLGFQNMRGVRDQVEAFRRLTQNRVNQLCPPTPIEMDMEDMFWEIPEEEVAKALDWAMRGQKGLQWFCQHRRGVRKLDRLGWGSSADVSITVSMYRLLQLHWRRRC